MHAGAAQTVVKQRPKRRNLTRRRLDGRMRAAKRARELADRFMAMLGDRERTLELEANVRRASELIAIAEQLRADRLRGKPVPPDDIVRADRLAEQVVRRLGIKAEPQRPAGPSLAEYLKRGEDDPA